MNKTNDVMDTTGRFGTLKGEQRQETGHNDTLVIGLTVKTPDGYGKIVSLPYTDTLEISVDGASGLYNIDDLKSL